MRPRFCRLFALGAIARIGAEVVDTYISGYRRDRPCLLQLLADVRAGRVDLAVCEALDRIARDGKDISWLGKKLRFDRVRLVTSTEGEIDEVKLAVAGLLGSMFLTNLKKKTLRGMKAAVLVGRIAGGKTYADRRVVRYDERGTPVRGAFEIDASSRPLCGASTPNSLPTNPPSTSPRA